MERIILCHSGSIFDVPFWEQGFADTPKANTVEFEKAQAGPKAVPGSKKAGQYSTPSPPQGNTWSQRLVREHYPARWITYRGHHILIKIFNQGEDDEHGRVIFSANPSFEHLKIIPKGHEDYEEAKKEVDKHKKEKEKKEKKKEEYGEEWSQKVKEEEKKARRIKEKRREEKRQVRSRYMEAVKEKLGLNDADPKELEEYRTKIERKAKKKVKKEEEKDKEREPDVKNEDLAEVLNSAEQKGEKQKEKALKTIQSKAEEEAISGEIDKHLGSGYGQDVGEKEVEPDTGDEDLDKKLKNLKLDLSESKEILAMHDKYLGKTKEIDKAYKDEIPDLGKDVKVDTSTLQGVGIDDFDTTPEDRESAVEKALKREVNRYRAESNGNFYERLEEGYGNKTTNRAIDYGTLDTVNGIAGTYLEGKGLSKEMVEYLGPKNASQIMAGVLGESMDPSEARKEMEEYFKERATNVVDGSLENVRTRDERIKGFEQLADEGTVRGGTMAAAKGRERQQISKELGIAAGSLESAATTLDHLRDIEKGNKPDLVMPVSDNIADVKDHLKAMGVDTSMYKIEKSKDGDGYQMRVPHDKFKDLVDGELETNKRSEQVDKIKKGETYDPDWTPGDMPKEFYKVKTPDELSEEKKKEYEKFTNKPGEPGYSHLQPDGATLYRKKGEVKLTEPQQKMIQMAETTGRYVAYLGPGTGKTLGFMGIVSDLKAKGKLNNFAFHTMPSRLRKEFWKDKDQFFPNLKALDLDQVKGFENKKKKLQEASEGKYDLVFSGHDSMKQGPSKSKINKHLRDRREEYWNNISKEKQEQIKEMGSEFWKEFDKKEKDKFIKENSLPNLIASMKPGSTTIDEAHEGISSMDSDDSQRFRAVKQLADNSDYFVPSTGTVIKRDVRDLGQLLNVTRPDKFGDPKKWAEKFENINQGTTVYQDQVVDNFRRTYDDVMLSEHLDIDPQLKEKAENPDLTDAQKKRIRQAEETYHKEKELSGYGLMNKKTMELKDNEKGEPQIHDVGFQLKRNDGSSTKQHKKYLNKLKESGHIDNPDDYEVVPLGRKGAAARRDSRYDQVLHGGEPEENGKVQKLLENFDQHAQKGEKQVIFCDRKESVETLKKAFKQKYGYEAGKDMDVISGDTPMGKKSHQRNGKIETFNRNPNSKVLICTQAGKTGINLQGANVNHWFSRDNTYYLQDQGNRRTYRKGQTKDVQSYYYDTNTIFDQSKVERVRQKKDYTAAVDTAKPTVPGLVDYIAKERKKRQKKQSERTEKASRLIFWLN